ncbi:MAG TPA: YfiR family protein [Opitutus sp.]|nr:YfiR family protein [Opitutus sp.]
MKRLRSLLRPARLLRPRGSDVRRFTLVFALLGTAWAGAAEAASEYDVKAAFLYNFTRFVEWPGEALPPVGAPLVIGIVGQDPFGSALDQLVRGESVQGRPVQVRRFSRRDRLDECHVLYISRTEAAHLPALLERLKGRPVLTVSDCERFAYDGGTIGLVMERGKVRFQINLDAARAAKLAISARLLRPATVIRGRPQSKLTPAWDLFDEEPELAACELVPPENNVTST